MCFLTLEVCYFNRGFLAIKVLIKKQHFHNNKDKNCFIQITNKTYIPLNVYSHKICSQKQTRKINKKLVMIKTFFRKKIKHWHSTLICTSKFVFFFIPNSNRSNAKRSVSRDTAARVFVRAVLKKKLYSHRGEEILSVNSRCNVLKVT